MCYSSNCPAAKDKPIVSQKVFLDFQKYPPQNCATAQMAHISNFLLKLLDRLGYCANKLNILCGIVVLCLGWTLDIVWVFGQS